MILREIILGRNWRNLVVVGALGTLVAANVIVHLETAGVVGTGLIGVSLAIGVMVALVTLIGGRIVPSFTRNWLVERDARQLPAAFGMVDQVVVGLTLPPWHPGSALLSRRRLPRWRSPRG